MTRWEKLSRVLLLLVDSSRQTSGAISHLASEYGRSCDTLDRLERLIEETHASHQKANRQLVEVEARVSRLERAANGE